jgi:predicted dehydrogenase
MNRIKIAIIGAGAVAELCHLPAAQRCPELEIVALVDMNQERARSLAQRFAVPHVFSDYRDLPVQVDAVIIALPHFLHAPAASHFLGKGTAVLVEKPMALTEEEGKAMIGAARTSGAVLQVGHHFRFSEGPKLVKRTLAEGRLGEVQGFFLESGFVYDWPVTSGFFFSRAQAGGGVLVDSGSHLLDLLLWWLGDHGDAIEVDYRDDCQGGVEAECSLSLALHCDGRPVRGSLLLSRLRQLKNVVEIVGEHLTLEYALWTPNTVRLWPTGWDREREAFAYATGRDQATGMVDVHVQQLGAFAQAVGKTGPCLVPGESVLSSVSLIERCYRERQPLHYPWREPVANG